MIRMLVLQAYQEFSHNYLQARAYSQQTIAGYWWIVKSFVEAVGNIDTKDITLSHLAEWIVYMEAKGNTRMTIAGNMGRFRVFIEYLNLQGICYLSKEQIKPPRKPKTLPKYSTSDDIDKMIQAALSIRDKAIISLMFSTAIRNTELRNLKITDLSDNELRIYGGKGAKDRVVFLDQRSTLYLKLYLESRLDKIPFMFISHFNQQIAKSSLRAIVATASQRAGVAPARPHGIRHGSATHMLKNGANIREIQEYLGHESVKTTEIYTHVTKGDIKKSHDRIFNKL